MSLQCRAGADVNSRKSLTIRTPWLCNILLQHSAATHCNTVQNTAIHCSTLQRTATTQPSDCATHRKTLLRIVCCSVRVLQCVAVCCKVFYCNTLQHTACMCQRLGPHATVLKVRHAILNGTTLQHNANVLCIVECCKVFTVCCNWAHCYGDRLLRSRRTALLQEGYCNVLQCAALYRRLLRSSVLWCLAQSLDCVVAVCCSVLQCVVRCSAAYCCVLLHLDYLIALCIWHLMPDLFPALSDGTRVFPNVFVIPNKPRRSLCV